MLFLPGCFPCENPRGRDLQESNTKSGHTGDVAQVRVWICLHWGNCVPPGVSSHHAARNRIATHAQTPTFYLITSKQNSMFQKCSIPGLPKGCTGHICSEVTLPFMQRSCMKPSSSAGTHRSGWVGASLHCDMGCGTGSPRALRPRYPPAGGLYAGAFSIPRVITSPLLDG